MVNLKYPSGIKGKSSVAWVGMIALTLSPFFMYYHTYAIREHLTGFTLRNTTGEEPWFHLWLNQDHKLNVQYKELIDENPNYKRSYLDKKRLRIKSMENNH